jgi:biotin transport system substrate-specific component
MTLIQAVATRNRAIARNSTIVAIGLGAGLLAVSAKVAIPFYPVPLTMQTFIVIALGLALGPWRGLAAVILYLGSGAVGLPVFAGTPERGVGLLYMTGPTGGYLVGYMASVLVAGLLAIRGLDRKPSTALIAALVAGAIVYVPGLLWLGVTIDFDKPVLELGLFPFILGDLLKAGLAAFLFPLAWRLVPQRDAD